MSNIASINGKLKEEHGIYFSRKELYKALCSYNDHTGNNLSISELEGFLNTDDTALSNFAEFLLETFEPENKFIAA